MLKKFLYHDAIELKTKKASVEMKEFYLYSNVKPLSIEQNHIDQLVTLTDLKRNKITCSN